MFAPLFASPSASLLGAPLEHVPGRHITGHMARQNAARNNRRTASTAAGLMIGLALIAMATVVATSLKESFRAELGSTLTGDFLVTSSTDGRVQQPLGVRDRSPPRVRRGLSSSVRVNANRREQEGRRRNRRHRVDGSSRCGRPGGGPDYERRPGPCLLTQAKADDHGVVVGDPLVVEFAATGTQTLTVARSTTTTS